MQNEIQNKKTIKKHLTKLFYEIKYSVDINIKPEFVIEDGNLIFSSNWGCEDKILKTEEREIELGGTKLPAIIKYTECIKRLGSLSESRCEDLETKEYLGETGFYNCDDEVVKRKGTFVYLPLANVKEAIGDAVEKIYSLDYSLVPEEDVKEIKRKEREKYNLVAGEYKLYYYDEYSNILGTIKGKRVHELRSEKVKDHDEALQKTRKYLNGLTLINEEKYGDAVTISEYAKDHARYFFIDDKMNKWVLIFRDDSEYFNQYIAEKLTEIDNEIKQKFGEYAKKEIDWFHIIYRYNKKFWGYEKKIVIIHTAERRYREIYAEAFDDGVQVPLNFFADIITDFMRAFIDTYIVL